jgi:hypothetical protein
MKIVQSETVPSQGMMLSLLSDAEALPQTMYYSTTQGKIVYKVSDALFVSLGLSSGGGDLTYQFNQLTPSSLWDIVHNMGKCPSVMVVDSAGSVVEGDISYLTLNRVQVRFTGAFSGTAYLN